MTLLARALPHTTIEELLIGNNNIADGMNECDWKLTELEGASQLMKSIARNKTLRILDFQNNSISANGAACFIDLFKENNTLNTVLLDGNKISLATYQQLIPFIVKNTSITVLTLPSVVGTSSEIKNMLGKREEEFDFLFLRSFRVPSKFSSA